MKAKLLYSWKKMNDNLDGYTQYGSSEQEVVGCPKFAIKGFTKFVRQRLIRDYGGGAYRIKLVSVEVVDDGTLCAKVLDWTPAILFLLVGLAAAAFFVLHLCKGGL